MNTSNNVIGKNIRLFRERLGLNQEALAEYLKVSHVTVSYYENGHRIVPLETILKLSNLFGIDATELSREDAAAKAINIAFRAGRLSKNSIEQIADFRTVVKNYLKMKRILSDGDENE